MNHEKHERTRRGKRPLGLRGLVVGLALAVAPALPGTETAGTRPEVGEWEGAAQVAVTWASPRELPVSLHIRPDGSVTGRVGDADLTKGRIAPKRRWLQRGDGQGQRTTHVVRAALQGSIVAAEGITRREVFVHLKFDGDHASGSLATSGTKIGGKERMSLLATPLALTHRSTE